MGHLGRWGSKLFRRLASVSLLALLWCGTTPALSRVEYVTDITSDGLRYIVVKGEFEYKDDIGEFERFARSHGAAVVAFDSPGGSTYFAMELGRSIRRLGLNTLQPKQLECASACSLAFMGGVRRAAMPGAIGVHRSSFSADSSFEKDEAVAQVQQLTADLFTYISEMGVDPKVLQIALSYDQTDMRYLSGSEMADLRVTTPSDGIPNTAPAATVQPASPAPISRSREDDALTFVKEVIGAHNREKTSALSAVANSYSAVVTYYGKYLHLSEVLADKRSYFERWPERSYFVRDDSVSVSCDVSRCRVTGMYDWAVRSYPRNRQAKGMATFSYVVDLSNGLHVVGEMSEVVK